MDITFVKKKGGVLCPCIDYCSLNEVSVKYPYLHPLLIFVVLITSSEGDEWKQRSVPQLDTTMSFCLAGAPSIFLNYILPDCLGKYVIAYFDNILISSSDLQSHVSHVSRVLEQLREHQLFVKGMKC